MSMEVDKNKAIINFLLTCPEILNSPLYFNFINAEDSNKQIVTESNDYYTQRPYIDGSVKKLYSFTILDFRSISDQAIIKLSGYDSENVEELADVQALINWIKEQDKASNYPDFGSACQIEQMRCTNDSPTLAGINTEVTPPLAMYSVTIQIDYIDYSEVIWR